MSRLGDLAQAVFVSGLLFTSPAGAQEEDPLVGDRPDFTESAVTIAPGSIQIEAGATYSKAGEKESYEIGEVLLRIGLTRQLELRVGLNSYSRVQTSGAAHQSGFVDSSLGLKLALGEVKGWTTALLLSTTLPTGSTGFRESDLQPDAVLAVERDLASKVSIGTNFGYGYVSAGGERFGETFASTALGVGLSEATGSFFELYGFTRSSGGGPDTVFLDAGLTHALGPDFQLDFRLGSGLNSASGDLFAGTGLVWRR